MTNFEKSSMYYFRTSIFLLLCFLTFECTTSKKLNISKVDNNLIIILNKMRAAQNISFLQYKHMYNEGANYEFRDTTFMFNSFDTLNKILPRFQARSISDKSTSVFNGTDFFSLQDVKKAHTTISDTKKAFDRSASLFRQSWANILNILPTAINNTAVVKNSRDTMINATEFYVVNFYYPSKKFNPLSGLSDLGTDTTRWNYELIVDKRNFLPSQFNMYIQTNNIKTPNFIKVAFDKIDIRPDYPADRSWFFSTYAKEYPIYSGNEKRAPLITSGKPFPTWKLPLFDSQLTDTLASNSDFQDNIVLYAFWIKNCGYSQDALSNFNKIERNFDKQKFRLIAVNCEDTRKDVEFFYKKLSPTYPIIYNGNTFSRSLGIYGHPTFVLVNKSNTVVKVFEGFDHTQLTNSIREALNAAN